MGWLVYVVIVVLLLTFNFYVADGLIRMQRDLKQVQKLLLEIRKNS